MSLEKRIRLLSISLIAITLAEIFLAVLDLLSGHTLARVALIYGPQLLLLDGFILSSRQRLKRELHL